MLTFDQSLIEPLLSRSSPPTIAGLIVSILIGKPIKRVPGWARSHVSQKCLEARKPMITHRDSTTTIFRKLPISHVGASRFGCLPRVVGRSWAFSFTASGPVTFFHSGTGRRLEASAAFGVAAGQFMAGHRNLVSAGTSADPENSSTVGRWPPTLVSAQNAQKSVVATRSINKSSHRAASS